MEAEQRGMGTWGLVVAEEKKEKRWLMRKSGLVWELKKRKRIHLMRVPQKERVRKEFLENLKVKG